MGFFTATGSVAGVLWVFVGILIHTDWMFFGGLLFIASAAVGLWISKERPEPAHAANVIRMDQFKRRG